MPWTFHRAVDAALDPRRAWRQLQAPAGPDRRAVGAARPQGLAQGYDDLLALATGDPDVARLLMPGGGLLAEHVPWFVRAGVTQFHVGAQVRPGQTYKSYVDAELVRSWRLLLDSAPARLDRPMILIDPPAVPAHGRLWSHLASDTSYDELHVFAARPRHPRARLRPRPLRRARRVVRPVVAAGAVPVSSRELVGRLVRAGLRRRKSRAER